MPVNGGGRSYAAAHKPVPVYLLFVILLLLLPSAYAQYNPASLWRVEYWFETESGTQPGHLNVTLRWPPLFTESYWNPPYVYRDCWHRVHIDSYNSPQGREYHSGGREAVPDRFESNVGLSYALLESTDHPVYYDASHGSISGRGVSVIKLVWQGAGDPPPQVTVYTRIKVTAVAGGWENSGNPPRGTVYADAIATAGELLAEAHASAPSSITNENRSSEWVFVKSYPVRREQRTGRYVAEIIFPVQLWEQVLMTPYNVTYNSPSDPRIHGTRMGYAAASFWRLVDVYQAGSVVLLDMGVSLTDGAGWFCDPALCRLRPATGQTGYTYPLRCSGCASHGIHPYIRAQGD